MPVLYDLGTGAYHAAVRIASLWKPKAKAWVKGREGMWQRLGQAAPALQGCLWMHCASVGEFEQGRPVLEAVKAERPELPVLLTFFSPSGYEARKALATGRPGALVTHVEYLPPDGRANAERLQRMIQPSAALFVKYEFWYHHLQAIRQRGVPTFLVSALFRGDQPFFKWYGNAWREMLGCFTRIFTQDEASRELIAPLVGDQAEVGGDTRFDRVVAIRAKGEELPLAKAFATEGPVLLCGSTWPPGERMLAEALAQLGAQAPKCIVVPHELHKEQLERIESTFPKPLALWSELEQGSPGNVSDTLGRERQGTLLVDRVGVLSRLYRYGRFAYVGGGFATGIHNLLEAAVWGVPVLFGPKHRKFPEAQGLIDAGAGVEVHNTTDLVRALQHWLNDPAALKQASEAAARYVQERTGAAERVASAVLEAV